MVNVIYFCSIIYVNLLMIHRSYIWSMSLIYIVFIVKFASNLLVSIKIIFILYIERKVRFSFISKFSGFLTTLQLL